MSPTDLDAALGAVATWPVTAAVAVVDADGVRSSTGDVGVIRPWASVTKLLTSTATLVAVEEGTVDLDAPAGPPGATVAHLLAHASGLDADGRVVAEPGRRRIYSNAGFDLLGAVVSERASMPFAEYLTLGVLQPLGMAGTHLEGPPASGASGPLRDLAALGCELLAPTLVSPATLATATSVAFAHLDGVLPGFGPQRPNDWGLGFELRGTKHPHWTGARNSPRTFGHFGQSGSFLWVDPDAGIASAELADTPFGPWAVTAWPALADGILDSYTLR